MRHRGQLRGVRRRGRVDPRTAHHHHRRARVPAGSVPRALLVRAQPGQLRVGRLADVALVGPLAGVQPDVVPQRGRLAEAAVAEAADERLVQRVNAHVRAQVAAGVEAAVANDAAHPARGGGGDGRRRTGRGPLGGVGVVWEGKTAEAMG